eukprot:GFKZ01009638.1.p1 GENE.GFKZ01009638.1~~GFKZ01009638.1.p1  ORF type:complete len:1397 (-),score=191.62 GFKZ01009638.1:931-4536(-)
MGHTRAEPGNSFSSLRPDRNPASNWSEPPARYRSMHAKQEETVFASQPGMRDNRAPQNTLNRGQKVPRSNVSPPIESAQPPLPEYTTSSKRPRSLYDTNDVADERGPCTRRQRFKEIERINPTDREPPMSSRSSILVTSSSMATKLSTSSRHETGRIETPLPHTTSSTTPHSQALETKFQKTSNREAVSPQLPPKPPPTRNNAYIEVISSPPKPQRSSQRFLQPFQPTASSRRHPAAPSRFQTAREVPNMQPSGFGGSSNSPQVRIPRSVPVHDYPQSGIGWRQCHSVHPSLRGNEFEYPRPDGYATMREMHARSQMQMPDPRVLTPHTSERPAWTTSSRETQEANRSLATGPSPSTAQLERGQATPMEPSNGELQESHAKVKQSEGNGSGNIVDLYGPQIEPKRDPDLLKLLQDNHTTLLGFLRKHAMLLVDPWDDDESTWFACKFCPTFHCKTRKENYIMMIVTPFGANKIVNHHKKEHPETWEKYSACSDAEKDKFFDKFEMPERAVFLKRLFELRPGWEKCGKKKTMTGKPQASRFDSNDCKNAMAAVAAGKGSLERFQVTPSGDEDNSCESEGINHMSDRDTSNAQNVAANEVCIGRRNVVQSYLQEDPVKERAKLRFNGAQSVCRNPLIARGLIRTTGGRRACSYERGTDIIFTGVQSDKDIRPTSAEMGLFCPCVWMNDDAYYEAELRLMSVVLFYLARGFPLDKVCEMVMQAKTIAKGLTLEHERRTHGETETVGNAKDATTEISGKGEKGDPELKEEFRIEGEGVATGEQSGTLQRDADFEIEVKEGVTGQGEDDLLHPYDCKPPCDGSSTVAAQGVKEELVQELKEDIEETAETPTDGHEEKSNGEILEDKEVEGQENPSSGSISSGSDDKEESEKSWEMDVEDACEDESDAGSGAEIENKKITVEDLTTETNIWNCGNSICAEGMRIFREKFNDERFQYGRRGNKGFVLGTRRCEPLGEGGVELLGTVQIANGTWKWMHILSVGEGGKELDGVKQMLDCLIGNWRLRILGLKSGLTDTDSRAKDVERNISEMLKGEGVGKWFEYLENGKVLNFNVDGMQPLEMFQLLEDYGEWFAREYDGDKVIKNEFCMQEVNSECTKLTVMWRSGNTKMGKMKNMRVGNNLIKLLNRLWGLKFGGVREGIEWRGECQVHGRVNVLLERVLWARNLETFLAEMNSTYIWSRRKGIQVEF